MRAEDKAEDASIKDVQVVNGRIRVVIHTGTRIVHCHPTPTWAKTVGRSLVSAGEEAESEPMFTEGQMSAIMLVLARTGLASGEARSQLESLRVKRGES